MIELSAVLAYLYPGLSIGPDSCDVVLFDDGDGEVYIARWRDPRAPPDEAAIAAAWQAMQSHGSA